MSGNWGRHLEGAERERFVQISDTLKQYWFDAQCEYLASRLVDDGYTLVKVERPIEELIAASSLGTPAVEALRKRTPPEVVDRIMQRVKELEAEEANKESEPLCELCEYPERALHHQGQGKGAHPFMAGGKGAIENG